MIVEARNDLIPNAMDNFRTLCAYIKEADARGVPFQYKDVYGSKEAQQLIPKGHILFTNDEKNGTYIYRSPFYCFGDKMSEVKINFIGQDGDSIWMESFILIIFTFFLWKISGE